MSMRHATRWRAAVLGALATATLIGCSLAAASRTERRPCVIPEARSNPCPDGQFCDEEVGRCVPDEVCNGLDDDQDGRVDEGHDVDMDGVTWCGPEEVDCDDSNPGIYPAHDGLASAAEVCDGADNDCDGRIDESLCSGEEQCVPRLRSCAVVDCSFPESPRCPAGAVCDTTLPTPTCVTSPDACNVPGVDCDPGTICDEFTGVCIVPLPPGSACDRNIECGDGSLCFSADALGIQAADRGGKSGICATACCQEGDCAAGFSCWAPGLGSRACVPDALLASGPQGAPTPPLCGHNSDCSSNWCALEFGTGYHADALVLSSCEDSVGGYYCDCSVSQPGCTIDPIYGGYCNRGLCYGRTGSAARCTEMCRSSDDCLADQNEGCIHTNIRLTSRDGAQSGNAWLPMCEVRSTNGRSLHGASCMASSECLDEACIGAEPGVDCAAGGCTCARTCCDDSSCTGGERCQPTSVDGVWEMHCRMP